MIQIDPTSWNRGKAAHLLVRAGFGATPEQIDAAAARPMEEVVDGLLKPAPSVTPPAWVKPGIELKPNYKALGELTDEQRREKRMMEQRAQNDQLRELICWWLERMTTSPSPLQEKMTLFWHGHFATSQRKVNVPYMMYLQNQTFREHGLGLWKDLITAVSQDPAMLIYLDNARSKAGAPNENYARELMELFTLGEGHYTEQDIKESARAFTGWTVGDKAYVFQDMTKAPAQTKQARKNKFHDDGPKTFFGHEGNFDGHDIIRIILGQEQASRFMVAKLWSFFAYENPEPELIEALAPEFRASDHSIARLMKSIFMSPQFYSSKAIHTQIKSPAQWLAGSCITLGIAAPDDAFCLNAMRSLGQELFAPPNVKGWDGGYAWITTSSLTQRYNLAGQLINHRPKGAKKTEGQRREQPPYTIDAETVLPKQHRTDIATARNYLEQRIYQTELPPAEREKLNTFLGSQPPAPGWSDAQIRNIVHIMMSTPQYQLT